MRWLLLTHDRARAVGRERTHRKRCEAAKHQLAGQCTVEVTSMVRSTAVRREQGVGDSRHPTD